MELVFFGIAALILLGLIAVPFVLTWRVVGWVASAAFMTERKQAKRVRTAQVIATVLLVALIGWNIYTGINPDDSFYLTEFQTVTTRQAPSNAEVVAKHATYPDFHGDYCSFSRIRLPRESYARLQNELSRDQRFELNSRDFVSAGFLPEKPLPSIRVVSTYTRKGLRSDKHYSIQFLSEDNLVEVHLCDT